MIFSKFAVLFSYFYLIINIVFLYLALILKNIAPYKNILAILVRGFKFFVINIQM